MIIKEINLYHLSTTRHKTCMQYQHQVTQRAKMNIRQYNYA